MTQKYTEMQKDDDESASLERMGSRDPFSDFDFTPEVSVTGVDTEVVPFVIGNAPCPEPEPELDLEPISPPTIQGGALE